MTSLHEELSAGVPTACKLCRYIAALSPFEAAEWSRELALPLEVIGNTAVVNALRRRNIDLAETSVRRHRANHKGAT